MNAILDSIKNAQKVMNSKIYEIKISLNFGDGGCGIIGELDDVPAFFSDNGIGCLRELKYINLNGLVLDRASVVTMMGELQVETFEREASEDRNPRYENDAPFNCYS